MMSRRLFPWLLLLLACCAGLPPASARAGQDEIEADEYAVYSAAVSEVGARERVEAVLIRDSTEPRSVVTVGPADEVVAELLDRFAHRNAKTYRLREGFRPPLPFQLISEAEERAIHWSSTPVLAFSRVAFNGARDTALVYVSYSRDRRHKKARFLLLHKEQGGWRVGRKLPMLVALRRA